MQAVMSDEHPIEQSAPLTIGFRVEWLAYVVVILLLVVLRFASLDTAPMADVEANQALTAWDALFARQAHVGATSASALTFWGQFVAFATVNTGELGARLVVAGAGVVLSLLPLLFRARLGATRTFLLVLLWGFSPIALAASRTADPAVWMAIFSTLLVWAVWNWVDRALWRDAVGAAIFAACLIFLSGAAGWIVFWLLLLALAAAVLLTMQNAPMERDLPGDVVLKEVNVLVQTFPWVRVLPFAALAVGIIATGFLLRPAGIGMIGEALAGGLRGFTQRQSDIGFYPLVVTLVYDLGTVLLGVICFLGLRRWHMIGFADRFAMLLALLATVGALLYPGASAGYALLIVLPLGWLVAHAVAALLEDHEVLSFWDLVSDSTVVESRQGWVKWMLALIFAAALVMLGTHLQELARAFLIFAPEASFFDNVPRLFDASQATAFRSLIWLIMSSLFIVVGGFLVASIWGNYVTAQGLALGALGFVLVSGVGGAWNATVVRAGDPAEIWQTTAISADMRLLSETLTEISSRNTRGAPVTPLAVVRDASVGLDNDGLVAWLLRNFESAYYVNSVDEAAREEMILMPLTSEDPDLGGSYVGQQIALREHRAALVSLWDLPAWLAQRRLRSFVPIRDSVVLWLRLDVYNAVPVHANP